MWNSLPGKMLMTVLISMVPVVELRGAIPIAVAHGLDYHAAIPLAILGNLIPVPFILIFIRRIFHWMHLRSEKLSALVDRMEARVDRKRAVVEQYEFLGLIILVAIPLPGTGAWTGALVAALMRLRFRRALPAIVIGVLIAGMIVSFVTYGAASIVS